MGYRPWGRKESDTTEQLNNNKHKYTYLCVYSSLLLLLFFNHAYHYLHNDFLLLARHNEVRCHVSQCQTTNSLLFHSLLLLSHSVVSDSVRPHRRQPTRLLCPGVFQARIVEWATISFSNACIYVKSLQSCPTLCDPLDSSPPGSSVHGIL